jgi:hypothetical protein
VTRLSTVPPFELRTLRRCAALGLVGACLAVAPAPALADAPPDISASSIACADTTGGGLRAGDDIACTFVVRMATGTEWATVTGVADLPSDVTYVSATYPATYDDTTRQITYPPTALGLMSPGDSRTALFHVTLNAGLAPGTPIAPPVAIKAKGTDNAIDEQTFNPPALSVSPEIADLTGSTAVCTDVDGGTLLPGDEISCDLQVLAGTGRDDAAGVNGTMTVAGAAWLSGGTTHTPITATFASSLLGAIASGDSKTVNAHFQVAPTALGGSAVHPAASLFGTSFTTAEAVTANILGDALTVAPGPAVIVASSLLCFDANGGIVLAGDTVDCSVTVAPALGHEDLSDARADIAVPPHVSYLSGADSIVPGTATIGPSFGAIAAGALKTVTTHFKIDAGTPADTVIGFTALLSATSVPLGGPLTRNLISQPFVVGQAALVPPDTPVAAEPDQPAITPPVTPPIVVAKGYKLRAKTIRIRLWSRKTPRRTWDVRRWVTRTPKQSGKLVKKLTVPKKGRFAAKKGRVRVKGTRLVYTRKKGKRGKRDTFHYTVTDASGKKATGKVIVTVVRPKT